MADPRDSSGPRTSAPDLEILGDQVTLHPSGYIEPPERRPGGDKERNLVENMARFRSSPLEYAQAFESSPMRFTDPAQIPPRSLPTCIGHGLAGVRPLHRTAHLLLWLFGEYDTSRFVHTYSTKANYGVGGEADCR